MKGYLNNPEGTRAAFWEGEWLRSGDIGVFDDNGYLYIVDRLKDMVITGGENVYPREVEEVLYQHPAGGGMRRHRPAGPAVGGAGGRFHCAPVRENRRPGGIEVVPENPAVAL